tara:strand:- start:2139 stop:2336 length:198 start_codon:yes stop_codon:yes gene_type:complete
MAQCTTRTLTTATLVLSEGEARYLLALTQNYLQGHSEDEDEEDAEIRHSIFSALNKAGVSLTPSF